MAMANRGVLTTPLRDILLQGIGRTSRRNAGRAVAVCGWSVLLTAGFWLHCLPASSVGCVQKQREFAITHLICTPAALESFA